MITVITEQEADALGGNWIGAMNRVGGQRLVKTQKQAEAWVRKMQANNSPAEWCVFECKHFATGESIGWGALAR